MSREKRGWFSKLLGGDATPPPRVVHLCAGPNCCRPDEGKAALEYLSRRLTDLRAETGQEVAGCVRAACFNICGEGPIAVVMPDNVWYSDMNPKNLDRLLSDHLQNGNIVTELSFEAPIEARSPLIRKA